MQIIDTIDSKIRRAFSSAALQYDVLTSLHKEIGRELMKKVLEHEPCERVLDIGMGTGWLTNRLKFFLPESLVVGIDFAEGMVEKAKHRDENFTILQADAMHLPFKNESFDVIISNLAFQWVDDLKKSFCDCYQSMQKGGQMHFTMFGHNTLNELFESFEQTKDKNNVFFNRLAKIEDVSASIAQAGFGQSDIDYERIKVHFPNMLDLMRWTKSIGANALSGDVQLGKQWLARANNYYNAHHRDKFGIHSTFEVIWVKAVK